MKHGKRVLAKGMIPLLLGVASVVPLQQAVNAAPVHSAAADSGDAAKAARGLELARQLAAAKDPAATYAGLNSADRDATDYVTKPAKTVTLVQTSGKPAAAAVQPDFAGCWDDYAKWEEDSVYGNALFTWWLGSEVCVSGGSVYSVRIYDAGAETDTPTWAQNGNPVLSKKNVYWEGRALENIDMRQFFQDYHYCAQNRQNADGNHYLNSSNCNIDS
ncbi:hypothetical protein GCM10009839_21610 [Catenulispora yoronensis]|uniref:Uncharacterized protein n=1 Tax=Catenulispora yoronensis TaxID=450799 RepID=A0ABN2TWC5_9ACTN